MHSVKLILHLSLKVSPLLLVLPPLLGAVDHYAGRAGPEKHQRSDASAERCVATGVAGVCGVRPDGIVLGVDGSVGQDLADASAVAREADAGEGVVAVLAEATVEAGVGVALVDFLRAVFAGESGQAGAGEVIHSVGAGSTVCTRSVLAVVVVLLAVPPNESVLADTLVVVDELEADSVVLAGAGDAVVDHLLTVSALEAVGAHAGVSAGVAAASGRVLARVVRRANVEVGGELAVGAVEP